MNFLKKILQYIRIIRACDHVKDLNKGDNFFVGPNTLIYPCKHIDFGNNVFISRNVTISTSSSGHSPIVLGSDIMIAERVMIIGGNHNISKTDIPMNKQGEGKQGSIIIEDDVWIGAGSIILTEIKIGKGSVIGAGSIVTKSIPEYSIVAGNPAKIIKKRSVT